MKKLIVANWKTYLTLEESIALSDTIPVSDNIILAPAIMHLGFLVQKFPNLKFATQDVSSISDNYGPFTGETPVTMWKDTGVNYAIIGHSERRSNLLDSAHTIGTKLQYCLNLDITPIICIGETLEDRKSKKHLDVISSQLHGIFDNIGNSNNDIIIAYEPFWSVGTGSLPTTEEIKEVITKVREIVNFVDNRLFLVYGGSISMENVKNLIALEGLDGLLIGKASTDIEQFRSILNII